MKATTALPTMLLGLVIPLLVWSQSTSRLQVEGRLGQGVQQVGGTPLAPALALLETKLTASDGRH